MTYKRDDRFIASFIDPGIFDNDANDHFDEDGKYIYSCEEQYVWSDARSTAFRWNKNVKRIFFSDSYNYPIDAVSWPATVFEIHFGAAFNQSISDALWPDSLKKIYLDKNFSRSIPEDLLFRYRIYKDKELLTLS